LGIGIGCGQCYWILGIGWLSWYRSNPKIQDIMQEFQDISEISGHSGQILKFQEFQDKAQACLCIRVQTSDHSVFRYNVI